MPRTLGGVKIPSERAAAILSRHQGAVLLGGAPRLLGAEAFGPERDAGRGLRRPRLLTRHVARRRRTLLHRNERRAGRAVEDEHAAHLGGDGDRGGAVAPGEDRGLRRDVVVPQIVMDHLEAPHHQAGVGAEGDDRVRPPVVTLAGAAPVVGARAAGGDEDEAALRVDREGRPGIAGAGAWSRLARPGNRVPGPAERAAAGVEAPHDAALHVDGAVVADRGADHDHVAAHRGGRRHLVVAEVAEVDAAGEIDLAAGAEAGARRAGVGVERDEAGVERAHEDPGAARVRARRRVPPRRHPARGDLGVAVRAIEAASYSQSLTPVRGSSAIAWL